MLAEKKFAKSQMGQANCIQKRVFHFSGLYTYFETVRPIYESFDY